MEYLKISLMFLLYVVTSCSKTIPIPSFSKLLYHYPGYKHFGGRYSHKRIIHTIGCNKTDLLHDTSALRISFAFNKIGGVYSIGYTPIHLSKHGKDSVSGRDKRQYLFHPLAFGPYMADKYGYPSISVLHDKDPIATKRKFWGKQGIMEIITYTKFGNKPKGHIALWNCDRLHQTKDWISKHTLLTIQFWEAPDSNCEEKTVTNAKKVQPYRSKTIAYNTKPYRNQNWKTVKYDSLRLRAESKMYKYNNILGKSAQKHHTYLHRKM
ncbi:uncharacterized protein LOC134246371 isoform X2 [Saccostrea cucullata]|uniref:uncharacterized protein LOC134246371 isoform X2 n=1 Tax=Saccostrea cuccullata TaxID=36930 RepID=UPI002ED4223F